MKECQHFLERERRESYAEIAKKSWAHADLLFCVFRVTFASFAFKKNFSLIAKDAS
jgi:hypothetical protein